MIYPLFRPLLFALDPETAHDMAFASLDAATKYGLAQAFGPRLPPSPVTSSNVSFSTPVEASVMINLAASSRT